MNLSSVENIDDLRKICKEGSILIMTYLGTNEEPYGYEDGVILYPNDFHRYFLIESFTENSFCGQEWDDNNTEKSPSWHNLSQLNAWEVLEY